MINLVVSNDDDDDDGGDDGVAAAAAAATTTVTNMSMNMAFITIDVKLNKHMILSLHAYACGIVANANANSITQI